MLWLFFFSHLARSCDGESSFTDPWLLVYHLKTKYNRVVTSYQKARKGCKTNRERIGLLIRGNTALKLHGKASLLSFAQRTGLPEVIATT